MANPYEEVKRLFDLAKKNPNNTKYIETAREIMKKQRKALPKELSDKFCKKCNIYFIPGKNCKVRISNKSVFIHCEKCNTLKRIKA